MHHTPFRLLATLLAALLTLSACGDGDQGDRSSKAPNITTDSPAGNEPGRSQSGPGADVALDPQFVTDADTTWDVELAADAVVIDQGVTATLVESDPAAGTYVFPTGALDDSGLAQGDAVIFWGLGIGRVTDISEAGGRVTVTTTEASLADIIDNGTMAWDAPLDLTAGFVPSADSGGIPDTPVSTARALPDGSQLVGIAMVNPDGSTHDVPVELVEGRVRWNYSVDGNDYVFELSVQGSSLTLKVQVTRKVGNRTALAYTAEGTLGSMTSVGSASFADGELSNLNIGQNGLSGSMELSIAAAGGGQAGIDFELPGLMFKYIVMVGPVPVTVGITTKIIGNISVPAEGSATASARFNYSGDTGFSWAGGDIVAQGNLAGLVMNPDDADSAAMIGQAVDAQFGVAFPRFSVSIFDQGLVPYIHTGFIAGSRLSWGPVCKTAYVMTVIDAGYDFRIMGLALASDKTSLFTQERKADQDGCSER